MSRHLVPALRLLLVFTLLIGGLYPLAVTLAAQLLFPDAAQGSLLRRGEDILGSDLLGQPFSSERYLWPRPSATAPAYDASRSSGSNLGPLSAELASAIEVRAAALRAAHPERTTKPPIELVTSSGSGLDPHVSPQAACWQAARIARARGLQEAEVLALVERCTEGRALGWLGEPRVNVLRFNLALDAPR